MITKNTSEARLIAQLGRAQVKYDKTYSVGDNANVGATILYPNDPSRKLFIVWNDRKHRCSPSYVTVTEPKSRWKLANGLAVGTPLATLEKWNGRPFKISGFYWDFGGSANFEGGKMEHWKHLELTLAPAEGGLTEKENASIAGEKILSSHDPVVQKAHVHVESITVDI
jgi:hypothetical protein